MVIQMNKESAAKRRDIIRRHYCLIYTMAFILAAGLVFYCIPVNQKSLIHSSDGFNIYYPSYVYIGRYIRDLIPNLLQYHTIEMFDFSIGYGDDILATLNWFGLGNAFYLLAALAPVKYASIMYTFGTILQIYLAGMAFLCYTGSEIGDAESRLVGALLYAFSAYVLTYGILFPTFLMVFVTFPLIINGATRVLESGRLVVSMRYVVAFFLLSGCGFYFIYMDIVAVAVYGILYGIFHYRNRLLGFIRVVCALALQTCISIGMACVILLPVIIAYFHSTRSGEQRDRNAIFSLYNAGEMIMKLQGILSNDINGYAIAFTIPIIVLIVVFLARYRDRYPVVAASIVVCVLGYFLPAVGSIMNGFSYSIDRWIYILHYFVALAVAIVLPSLADTLRHDVRLRRLANIVAVTVYIIWAAASVLNDADDRRSTGIHVAIVGLTLLVFVLLERRPKWPVSIYYVGCTVLTAVLFFAPTRFGGDGNYDVFKNFYTWHEIEASAFANADTEDEFHRTDINDTSITASLVTDTYSAESYYSIYNRGTYDFLNTRLVPTEGSIVLRGLDGRKALEMFFSVDNYALDRSAEDVIQNDLRLPLGFTYTSYMLEDDAADLDPLDRMQNVLQVVELEKAPKSGDLTATTDIASEWESVPCEYDYVNIVSRDDNTITASDNAEIHVQIPDDIDEDSEYYLIFHGLEWLESGFKRNLYIGEKPLQLTPMVTYAGQTDEYMMKVDVTDEMLECGYVTIRVDDGVYRLENIELRQLDISQYEHYYEQLTESVLEDVTYAANQISGSITADSDRLLLMTIPYGSGWTCMVDGVETPIYKADQGFSAVVITQGEHDVVWTYCTPGLATGAWISVISLLVLLVLYRKYHE